MPKIPRKRSPFSGQFMEMLAVVQDHASQYVAQEISIALETFEADPSKPHAQLLWNTVGLVLWAYHAQAMDPYDDNPFAIERRSDEGSAGGWAREALVNATAACTRLMRRSFGVASDKVIAGVADELEDIHKGFNGRRRLPPALHLDLWLPRPRGGSRVNPDE